MARLLPFQILDSQSWFEAEKSWLSWDRAFSNEARAFCEVHRLCLPVLDFLAESLICKIVLIFIAALSLGWATRHKSLRTRGIYLVICAIVVGLADFTCNQIKYLFVRLRPPHSIDILSEGVKISYSFPSNHAFNMGAMLGILYAFIGMGFVKLKKTLFFFLIVAFTISLGRVFEGKHFLSDVITGNVLGFLFSATLCRILLSRVQEHRSR